MSRNYGGLNYERRIIENLKSGKVELKEDGYGGFSSHGVDAGIWINSCIYGLEIKQNHKAQMGGTSIGYDENGKFYPVKGDFDERTFNEINFELEKRKENLNSFLSYIRSQEPQNYHESTALKIPFTCTKTAFKSAVDNGLLKPINAKIPKDISFIIEHYDSKNCHYIQIGECGLFYLKDNPLNFPIPQLHGQINIEIRLARSGSSLNKTLGEKTVSVGLRVQARLKSKIKSPYSLENIEDIKKLFGGL